MASSATSGYGSVLARGDGASPEVFTTIAETTNVEGANGFENTFLEATHNGSANNSSDWIWDSVTDWDDVTFTINYLTANTTHEQIVTDGGGAGTFRNYKFTAPSTSFVTFSAAVKSFHPKYPSTGKVEAEVAFKLSGKPSALMT